MSSPDGGTNTDLALPVAAIVCLAVGSYLLLVIIILVIRHFLQSRGVCECTCSCGTPDDGATCSCCVGLAECCNCCKTPNITSCLDSICPNRKKLGCVEILMCQCCGSGAEDMCACDECVVCCKKCCLCTCLDGCLSRCGAMDCSTIPCLCFTIHFTRGKGKPTDIVQPFTSLGDSNASSNSTASSHLTDVQAFQQTQADVNRNFVTSHNQTQVSYQPILGHQSSIATNSASSFQWAVPLSNSLLSNQTLSSSLQLQRSCSTESSTQTPRQFHHRHGPARPLKTARDRFTPRDVKESDRVDLNSGNSSRKLPEHTSHFKEAFSEENNTSNKPLHLSSSNKQK